MKEIQLDFILDDGSIDHEGILDAETDGDLTRIDAGDPRPKNGLYVLEVTDHGNATLYVRDRANRWRRLWERV